jgi:DNA polymerase-3 subunit epsilon
LVIFDLETTGLDPEQDRIVQLAAVRYEPERDEPQVMNLTFNPTIPIPPSVAEIHGIRDEDVAACPTFAKCADDVALFFRGSDLGGFNVFEYDLPLLQAELRRYDVPELELDGIDIVDALALFRLKEPRTLSAALAFYCGQAHDVAHEALADVRAAVRVLEAQLGKYGQDLPALATLSRGERCVLSNKLVWNEAGQAMVNFGKFKGRTLEDLAGSEPGYLRWMIGADFTQDVQELCRRALRKETVRRG